VLEIRYCFKRDFNDCRTESLAKSESRLLDSIASAEMQKEVESRVIKLVKVQSAEIEDQTGTKPSLTVVACSFAEQSGTTEEELHRCAEEDESSNPILFLSVDGREIQQIEKYRVHSRAFNITIPETLPENTLFGANPGPSHAVSDGYWIFLEPLPPGEHETHFKSSLTNPTTGILFFADEVKYHLNVVEAAESPSNSTSGQSTM
jgi:hypothetical protein